MIHVVVSIHDVKAGRFSPPMCYVSLGVAARAFADAVLNEDVLSKHPGDYSLFQIGEFDDVSAQMVNMVPEPKQLLRGDVVVSQSEPAVPRVREVK